MGGPVSSTWAHTWPRPLLTPPWLCFYSSCASSDAADARMSTRGGSDASSSSADEPLDGMAWRAPGEGRVGSTGEAVPFALGAWLVLEHCEPLGASLMHGPR